MNYTLTIDLLGDGKVNSQLDALLSKISQLSKPSVSFDDFLSAGSEYEGVGEKMGESISKGANKKLMSFNILDAWGKATVKGLNDFWNSAVKVGAEGKGTIKGLRETGGKDLAKVLALPDMNDLQPKMDKMKVFFAGIATLFNPFVGARLLSDLVPKGGMSGGKGGIGAIFGAAGAAGYGEIFVVVKVLSLAFKALVAVIKETAKAYENARQLYAKALTSGLGLNFTVKRGMLAEIIGVSDTEVIKFGAAMKYLNDQIEFSSYVLARTAPNLASVSWEFKVLQKNISAFFAELANIAAPSLRKFAMELSELVRGATVGAALLNKAWNSFKWLIPEETEISLLREAYDKLVGIKDKGAAPNPSAWMKQLPASSWEKMGLVVSGGNNSTNDILRKQVSLLQTLPTMLKVLMGFSGTGRNFGMSPNSSNP